MTPPREPLFLARQTYRRRRIADAARLLPVIGAVLFLLPLLFAGGEQGSATARGGIYVFAMWAVLIVVAGVLARPLSHRDEGSAQSPPSNEDAR